MKTVIPNVATSENLPAYVRIAATCLVLSGCAMSNASQQFRFEDYRETQSLISALQQRFPPGTALSSVRRSLEGAGAQCSGEQKNEISSQGLEGLPNAVRVQLIESFRQKPYKIVCVYDHQLSSAASRMWVIELFLNSERQYLGLSAEVVFRTL